MTRDHEIPNRTADDAAVPATDAKPTRSARKPRAAKRATEESSRPIERASDVIDPSSADKLDAEIRRCASDLYLARGGRGGDEVSDWLEAERMVRRTG
jgi:hypothetical protein